MRLFGLALLAIVIFGCGGKPEDKIVGVWHIDPATVQSTRLAPGNTTKPDWTDATSALGLVEVRFQSKTVTVSGFGLKSEGTWSLAGTRIETSGGHDTWPAMVFDSQGQRIHASIEKGGDRLQFDLVRS